MGIHLLAAVGLVEALDGRYALVVEERALLESVANRNRQRGSVVDGQRHIKRNQWRVLNGRNRNPGVVFPFDEQLIRERMYSQRD